MKTILFINDGSILNPIIHSQGLPLLNYVATLGYKSLVFSEEENLSNSKEKESLELVKSKFPQIKFIHSVKKVNQRRNWRINLYSDLKIINKTIYSEKVNIIHCRSLLPAILGLILSLKSRGKVKLLYDNRGLKIIEEIEKEHWNKRSLKVYFFMYMEKRILKYADSVVVVSEYFKSYLNDNYPDQNFEKKIEVIPNRTRINNEFINHKNRRQSDSILCVYTGSAVKWQMTEDFHQLLRAATKVFDDIKILILSYHVDEFEKVFLNVPELRNRVIIKEVLQENVMGELINCDFGILIRMKGLMSRVSAPLKFAEYLAAGLPVLISEGVGDAEEMVIKHKVGIVVKNKNYEEALDEMKKLLQDHDVHSRCRKLAENDFNIQDSFKQYLYIYQRLLNYE